MSAVGDMFAGLGDGIGDLFSASGDKKAAKGYYAAAGYAQKNAGIVEQSTAIQEVQASREIYRTMSGQQADIGGAGLANSGSALDIVRASAEQGALTKQLINYQGQITENGYLAEAASFIAQGKALKSAAKGKTASGLFKIGAALFSDERLKEDITFRRRLANGIGVYSFRYKGQPELFEGVMAHEVAAIMPEAVEHDHLTGLSKVDYDMIGVVPRILEDA